METRKITIVTTAGNQATYCINTDATTLGELKAALDANHIDYRDMSFFEGLTHSELVDDAAILPHDVNYKGTVTNELLFMLTTANKKTKSGADRAALYDAVVEQNLQDACMSKFGKNFTQCKNSELEEVLRENAPKEDMIPTDCSVVDAVVTLINDLYENEFISSNVHAEVMNKLGVKVESPYTASEITELFSFIQ